MPSPYVSFYISDPKRRHIHKATVADRVLHQAIFRVLYPIFDQHFIHDSYSCRVRKGTHAGVRQLVRYAKKVSANHCVTAYVLKCDVRKFFQSIDHAILFRLLHRHIHDADVLWILRKVIESYQVQPGKGLPLGNVTSQLFSNIYLNELDQWVKHEMKAKFYVRYCDDFLILDTSEEALKNAIPVIEHILHTRLQVSLHPQKVHIRKLGQGVDFLGYVVLPQAIMLRASTKRRMLRSINSKNMPSYLGMLSHANASKLRTRITNGK
jgi:retron-type reverse transcriptase